MITRRIAKNGMKGRKKTTILLVFVLSFTFLFLVAAMLLETSMSETKRHQREQLYGSWQAAYLEADEETKDELLQEDVISKAAVSEILGTDDTVGTIGTASDALFEIGNLVLQEGNLPVEPNEIVIEASVADALGLEQPVGEEIAINIKNSLVAEDMGTYLSAQYEAAYSNGGDGGTYLRRQLAEKEKIGNLLLNLNSKYCILSTAEENTPEYIEENGLLYEQQIELSGTYVITGVVQSYSGFWDAGSYALPNVFLSESGTKAIEDAIHQTDLTDLSDFVFSYDIFCQSDSEQENLYDVLKDSYGDEEDVADSKQAFRRNTYAFPETSAGSEENMTKLVAVIIFIVAFCAILQIFLTQMKRKVRKIALLKSIGTTNFQIFSMLMWEGIYLLCYSLPIGVAAGFLVGFGGVWVMNHGMGIDLSFYMNPWMILGGVLLGCLALFAGMAIPMRQAMHVPLVGTVSVANKKKRKKSVREQLGNKTTERKKPLTYNVISKSHDRLNWKNSVLTSLIAVVTSVILFGSLYLGYMAFGTYRQEVVEENRPSYVLSASHGYSEHELDEMEEWVETENEDAEANVYHKVNKVCLLYDNIESSPLISTFKEYLPQERYEEFIGCEPSGVDAMRGIDGDLTYVLGSLQTSLYTVEAPGELYEQIKNNLTIGEIDENEFIQGQSVILAIPLYQAPSAERLPEALTIPDTVSDDEMFGYVLSELAGYKLSYDEADSNSYQMDTSIQPGDIVYLSKKEEIVSESLPPISYYTNGIKVAGIIYYTPGEKTYPFFKDNNGFFLIGANGLLNYVSPWALYNPLDTGSDFAGAEEQFEYTLTQCPTKYGETYLNITTTDKANAVESASKYVQQGKNWGMDFSNYNEENWNLYYRAMNTAMILGIFAGTSVLIAMMILWNIHMSAFEQERRRIGVLQALGVTNREFANGYWKKGIQTGAASLLITHIVLFVVLLIQGENIFGLSGYPIVAHILLAIVYFVLVTLVGLGPIRELKKYAPNENIMS